MKITRRQLKQIIKEELQQVFQEQTTAYRRSMAQQIAHDDTQQALAAKRGRNVEAVYADPYQNRARSASHGRSEQMHQGYEVQDLGPVEFDPAMSDPTVRKRQAALQGNYGPKVQELAIADSYRRAAERGDPYGPGYWQEAGPTGPGWGPGTEHDPSTW